MIKYGAILILLMGQYLVSKGQEKLELLETNIKQDIINSYTDSYLWTKNWWLNSGMLIDTGKGGNAIAKNSLLTKQKIDSLHQVFTGYISTDQLRSGSMVPRIIYKSNSKGKPYITSSIYEIKDGEPKLLVQFKIEFDKGMHNDMSDVVSIAINNPGKVKPYAAAFINAALQRKPTAQENNITPPPVVEAPPMIQ
jgi:hypothetical protein